MFSDFVIAYLFLGGVGGGALVVLALLACANAKRRTVAARAFALPADVLRNTWVICEVVLALGILFLFMDLGRPERVVEFLTQPNLSAITVGAYALILALICGFVFCLIQLGDFPRFPVKALYALAVFSIIVGLVTVLYTGILLTQAVSVLFWMTPLVPALFAVSSLSGGIAVVMLGAAFATTRQLISRTLIRLGNVDTALIVTELLLLAAWLIWGLATAGPDLSAKALAIGPLAWQFWAGLVAIGLILPLVLEQCMNYGNHKTQTLLIAALVLFGAAMLRWCVVGAGTFDITQTGQIVSLVI